MNLLHRLSRPHLCGANNHPKLKAAAQPLPVAGGLNSMASLNGQNTGAEKSSQNHHSHAEHSRHVSVDPQASGENIVVVSSFLLRSSAYNMAEVCILVQKPNL